MPADNLLAVITGSLPTSAAVTVQGSATNPFDVDGWSDLDLGVRLAADVDVSSVFGGAGIWAYENVEHDQAQTCRIVLADGARADLSITGPGRIVGFAPAPDNDFRFIAALAVCKLGRGDRLIGLHLALELLRLCLVEAMKLRDRDTGSTVHRRGTEHDHYAELVRDLAAAGLGVEPRPNLVERAADLYATWRAEREPGYSADWSGLSAVIERGLGS